MDTAIARAKRNDFIDCESNCCRGRRRRFPDQGIDAPTPRTVKENEKENEAVEDRGFAVIHNRIQTALGVHHEISHGHFAARNESRDPSEQSEGNHEAAHELNNGADVHDSFARAVAARWKTEKFLAAVASEEKADNQPHDAVNRIREARQRVHGLRLFGGPSDVKIVVATTPLGRRNPRKLHWSRLDGDRAPSLQIAKVSRLRHGAPCRSTSVARAGSTGIGAENFIRTQNAPTRGSIIIRRRSTRWNSMRPSTVGRNWRR